MEKIVLKVDGMSCEHCVRAVANAVAGIAGTADVSVSLKDGTVSFGYDSGKAALDAIEAAIIEEGYTVRR
jgi:copper chaperone